MDANFWLDKWQSDQIGFHEDEPHPILVEHWNALGLAPGARVFVPLCGKSLDMHWLHARGYEVVGIELSEIAVRDYFAAQAIDVTVTPTAAGERFDAEGIRIYRGDFFALDAAELGPVDAIYDRAALIALPPKTRASYVAHLESLAAERAMAMMLITVDYDQSAINPPPFVVPDSEITTAFRHWHRERRPPRTAEVKGQPATETLYLMRRNHDHA